MNPEISIIVPIYNIENYVDKCIKSILSQSFVNFELLLINDGSQDQSLTICRKYLYDKRVRIISQQNKGLSAARNKGILKAKGKYLYFIDGDDYVSNGLLEILHDKMVSNDADIVQCGFVWVMENHNEVEEKYYGLRAEKILHGEEWFSYYERYSLLFTVAWNKLYRKELFDSIRFPVGKLFEDEYINFPLYKIAKKIVIVNKGLYYYVQRNSGICGTASVDKRINSFLEYAPRRMKILWHNNKTHFYRYLFLYYKELISFEKIAQKQHIDKDIIFEMKKQAIRLLGCFLIHSDVAVKEKMEIVGWNLKGAWKLWAWTVLK